MDNSKTLIMKQKFIIVFFTILTVSSSFSFMKIPDKKSIENPKCFACSAVVYNEPSRSGAYVTISWTGTANASYSYVAYTRSSGLFYSGTTSNTQITLYDNYNGGTISVTVNCADGTSSPATAKSWNP